MKRIAKGKLQDQAADREFDNFATHLNETLVKNKLNKTIIFFTSATSGGAVNQKHTVVIADGQIKTWDIEGG